MEQYLLEVGIGALGVLSAAVGHLWRVTVSSHRRVTKKLDISEKNQIEALKEIGNIKERLGVEVGRNEAMQDAHTDVIRTVAKAIIERDSRS